MPGREPRVVKLGRNTYKEFKPEHRNYFSSKCNHLKIQLRFILIGCVLTNPRGHAGFNLLLTSSVAYLLGMRGQEANLIILLSTALSTLPDIDLRLRITHRKYTHNVFFGIFAAFLIGLTFNLFGLSFYLGFWSTLIGVITHLAGDLMTYRGFNPIAPLGERKYSLKLFKSSNKLVNNAFLLAGVTAYAIYLTYLLPSLLQHLR